MHLFISIRKHQNLHMLPHHCMYLTTYFYRTF